MRRLLSILLTVCLVMSTVAAWAYWTAGSATGGNGAAAVTGVNQGATPTASAVGNAVTVNWAATTLTMGTAVTGYTVRRYSGSTPQTILTACTGTITATSCVENNVPTGVWTYSVTPVFATNWVGSESAKSSNVVVGNVAPTAAADSYSVAEDAVLTVAASGVLGNDSDPNSDPLTAVLASGVANGAVSLSANGGFTYTPNPNFNGTDSFTYKANDGTQNSNVVTVTLTVTGVNDAPVNSVPGPQQTPLNTNRVFSAANNNPISISDVDAGVATVQVRLTATNGTVTLPVLTNLTFTIGDGTSDATMTFRGTIADINSRLDGATFIPTNNVPGAATLQIVTSDLGNTGTGGTLTDTDSVTINVNSLGIFTNNQDIGTAGDPGTTGTSTYSAGTYTVAGGGSDIWNLDDHFQYLYRALTGDGRLTAKVVSQTQTPISPINPAKAGVMFRESVVAGSIQGMMDVMKANGSEFHWRLTTNGSSAATTGTAGIGAPYWVRITRVANVVTGERSLDGVTWTQQGTTQSIPMTSSILVGLAVSAVDNTELNTATFGNVALTTPPTAVADAYTTNENATLNVAARGVLANDTDPESDALTAVLVSGTAGLTLNANGSFTYVPPANFSGATSFTYKANDGVFDSTTVTVNLTVNPANQVPSFTKGANQSVTRIVGAQAVAGWATAISQGTGDTGQLVDFVVANTNNPLFSVQPAVSAAGTLTYTPAGTTTGVATVSVNIHDNGGTANGGSDLSAVQTFTITITPDTTGPTGGSVDAGGLVGTGPRYAASTTLSLNLAKGTDPDGVAATGNLLKQATATLTSGGTANGTCGAFGSYTLVSGGTDPASPKSDTVTDQACYRYQYVVLDTLGNPTTYTSPDIKVDLTAPAAPTLAHSVFTNTYWSSGSIVYYRSAASSGSFTTTSTATDTASGIVNYTFPALGTNWTSTLGAANVNTYAWSAAPQVPGAKSITATNNATGTSGGTSFTPTADDTAPSAGTVTPPNASQASTSVSVGFTTGTDGGSGVGTRLLQRQSATLAGTTCGSYGGWTTAATNPASSPFSDTVAAGFCYKYQYVVADNVGNTDTATSTNVVKVAPTCGIQLLGNLGFENGATTTPWTASTGVVTNAGSVAARTGTWNALLGGKGIVSTETVSQDVAIPANCLVSLSYWLQVTTTETSGPYDNFQVQVINGTTTTVQSYTDRDFGTVYLLRTVDLSAYAGQTITLRFQAVEDSSNQTSFWLDDVSLTTATDATGPTGGSVDASGLVGAGSRYSTSTTLSLVLAKGTDPSGVATTGNQLFRASASLTSGTCGTFGSYTLVSGGTDPASPKSDTVSDQTCFSYQYVVLDTLGNPTTYTSPPIKVDVTAQACGFQLLGNPGFENGATTTPWTASAGVVTTAGSVAARTGTWNALLGGKGIVSTETVSQDVAIPARCSASLSYWLRVTTTETSGPYDNFQVQVINGTTTAVQSYSDRDFGTTYVQRTVDLSAYAGQTITLRFQAVEDSTLQTSFWLDDVSLTTGPDVTGPTGGSVDASGLVGTGSRYAASTTLSLDLAKGTDPNGVAATGNLLKRATATLTSGGTADGSCGAFGSYTTVTGGTDPVSPKSDTVADQACYSYQYVVLDTLANATTYTSPAIKVDLTPPAAPSLVFSGFTNTYWPGSGTTVFYRSAATSGSFVATAAATDPKSGIVSYAFPALGTNWTSTPGTLGVNTYSWSSAPAVPGAKSITATNNATGVSGSTSFTPTADDTAPTAGTVSYVNGDTLGTSVTVTFAAGTDSGSGIGTRLLQRASAARPNGVCGAFGAFTTVTNGTNPTSPLVNTVTTGNCYKYQYVVADNVGNTQTASSASVATSQAGGYWAFNAGTGTTAVDGSGNANTGTLQTGAGWVTGRVGAYALNLTGATGCFVKVTPPVIDSSQSYSVAAWFKPTTLSGNNQTIASIDGTTVSPFYLQMAGGGGGVLQFTVRNSDSVGSTATTITGGAATAGTWTHLVAVYDNVAHTISLYKNGVFQSSAAFSSPWKATGNTVIGRGLWNAGQVDFVNGAIDEVHFYDRVLTAGEIASLAV